MGSGTGSNPPLVAVWWDDAHGTAPQWHDEIEVGKVNTDPAPIVTIGWVMKQDEGGITIACEQTSETTYRGSTTIPKEYIRVIKTLRKGSLWRRPSDHKRPQQGTVKTRPDGPE